MHQATFRQLEVFLAVTRLGTLSRAAEVLHLTQPSVTMQLKRLTERVGMPILEQVGRRMVLTEAGRLLEACSREIFEHLDLFEARVDELRGLRRGVLRVGIVNTAQYFFPDLLAGFCEQYPAVEVTLEVENSARLAGRVRNNLESLYLFSRPPKTVDIEAVPIIDNPIGAIAWEGHPLASERAIPLARFAEERFIMREPGSETRRVADRLFSSNGLTPEIRMVSPRTEAIKRAVAAGMGVTVLSELTLVGGGHGLVTLDVEQFPVQHQWFLVYRRDRPLPPVAAGFLDYLRSEAATRASHWTLTG